MMGMDGGRRLLEGEALKAQNVSVTLARFGSYFAKYWYGVVIAFALIVLGVWMSVVIPEYSGQAVDCYLYPNSPGSECWYVTAPADVTDKNAWLADLPTEERIAGLGGLALILVALFVGGSLLNGVAFYAMSRTGQSVLKTMRQELFHHMQRLTLRFYSENEVGNLMSRITNDTDTIQQVLSFALLQVVSGALTMVWIVIKMLQTNVPYALLSLIVLPIMFFATTYFSNEARKAFRKSRQQLGNVNADLQESIAGVREVQAFNREEENIAEFKRVNAANRDANVRAASFTSALNPVLEALGYVALGIVVVVGGISVLRNAPLFGTEVISLGVVFVFLQYVQRFNQPVTQIALLWTNIQSAVAGGERIFGLLDANVEIADKPNAQIMPAINGRVEFQNAHAEYKQGQPVLRGVNFTAEPGKTIAIVGPTGAGKTTIINLIPRFYDVTEGAVKIDGIDVRDVTMDSLRSQIGLVLQDTFLFSDTVMNNIRYGRLEASDEDVIAAAKMVSADVFVERLPESYQTVLGERGSGLSQGQRQLIAIARVALMNPAILILDEATSSVDTRTEKLIQKAFGKLLEGRTSFVIAQRISTVVNADLILVLDKGKIVATGKHEELMETSPIYAEIYNSQLVGDAEVTSEMAAVSAEEVKP